MLFHHRSVAQFTGPQGPILVPPARPHSDRDLTPTGPLTESGNGRDHWPRHVPVGKKSLLVRLLRSSSGRRARAASERTTAAGASVQIDVYGAGDLMPKMASASLAVLLQEAQLRCWSRVDVTARGLDLGRPHPTVFAGKDTDDLSQRPRPSSQIGFGHEN